MNYRVIKGEKTLTIFLDGMIYHFDVNDEKSKRLLSAIKNNISDEELRKMIVFDDFKEYCRPMEDKKDGVVITEDTILIDGEEISTPLANQIRRHYKEGISIEPIINFIRKVRLNPSYRIRNQLWNFIEASQNSGGFTLADDGDILAYKKVSKDYKDIYTGKFDNSVGSVVEMERKNVDDDPNNTCSAGLHFCAYSYLSHYGSKSKDTDKIMLVKINPKDVVSIPTDYGYAKARCCRYEVIQEVKDVVTSSVYHVEEQKNDEYFNNVIMKNDVGVLYRFFMKYYYEEGKYDYRYSTEKWEYLVLDLLYTLHVLWLDNPKLFLDNWKDFTSFDSISYYFKEIYNDCDNVIFDFYNNHSKKVLIEFYNYITGEHKTFKKKNKSQIIEILEEKRSEIDRRMFVEKYINFCKDN